MAGSVSCSSQHNVQIESLIESPLAAPPAKAVFVRTAPPSVLPLPTQGPGEMHLVTLERVLTRGKQGAQIGALPGAMLFTGNTAKGDLLAIALALAGASAGAITGGTVGLVEGGSQDVMLLVDRMRQNGVVDADVEDALRQLKTTDELRMGFQEATKGSSLDIEMEKEPLANVSDNSSDSVVITPVQVGFLNSSGKDSGPYQFVLTVNAHREIQSDVAGQGFTSKKFIYKGLTHSPEEWLSGGIQMFKKEHNRGCREIALAIAKSFFNKESG